MSHSTLLHTSGPRSILAIHNSDWSGPTLLRIVEKSRILAEIELPADALQALVSSVLAETVTEEEEGVAKRLLGLAKRPPPQKKGVSPEITWHGPAEKWTWPFTPDQQASLRSVPCCCVDGSHQVYGIGPHSPDLILSFGSDTEAWLAGSEEGDIYYVRFGQMRLEDFEKLPEHQGW